MKYCSSKQDLGVDIHYAAIVFDSIWVEGDERSRTNPGHGYPAHSVDTCKYIRFDSQAEMEDWVRKETAARYTNQNFVIIESKPKAVVTTVHVI